MKLIGSHFSSQYSINLSRWDNTTREIEDMGDGGDNLSLVCIVDAVTVTSLLLFEDSDDSDSDKAEEDLTLFEMAFC